MKRVIGYFIATSIALLALIPPEFIELKGTVNSTGWLWAALVSGFLAFMFVFTKANTWIKAIVLYAYINCFLSRAPYLSFTIYFSVIVCAYFYLLCLSIEDWTPIFRTIQSLFWLSVLLLVMQHFKKDTLLNFGKTEPVFFGTIFNTMLLSSYITCLIPFLVVRDRLYIIPASIIALISHSGGMVLSIAAGIIFYGYFKMKNRITYITFVVIFMIGTFVYAYLDKPFEYFFKGSGARFPVWKKTIKLVQENPYSGWGIGTFKTIFPVVSKQMIEETGEKHSWLRTHNCWIQFLFELGYVGFCMVLGLVGYLIWIFKRASKTEPIILGMAGLIIYGTNMMIHFPTRMTQIVLILICFLAYFETEVKLREVSLNG